jgi:hypothetical protein
MRLAISCSSGCCCVRNLVPVRRASASVSLVHCNMSYCALSLISLEIFFSELLCLAYLHCVCFVGLVIQSLLGLICGVLRIPYLQLHHIFLVYRVIALIPLVFTSSHQCIGRLFDLVSIAIHLGTVRFTFSCQF